MDDFVLIIENKHKAKNILNIINDFVENKLNLSLNKKTNYFPNKLGIDFCGYKVFETHILLRKRSIKKIKRDLKYLKNQKEIIIRLNNFKAHSKHTNSYNLRLKLYNSLSYKTDIAKFLI